MMFLCHHYKGEHDQSDHGNWADGIKAAYRQKRLERQDSKWAKKYSDKITKSSKKAVQGELNAYSRELMSDPDARKTNGKLKSSTISAYNNRMAQLMSQQVTDLRTPSGKVVQFVAKRGEIGVFMAISDAGYDITQLKNGIYESGKIAYKKKVVDKMEVG